MQLEARKPYQIFEAKSVPESWGIDPVWNYLYSYDNEESAF